MIDSKNKNSSVTVLEHRRHRLSSKESPMGPTFRRTRKGSEELVLRKHGLSEDQRKILLYANGNRSIEDFERVVPEVAESPEILAAMEELGFLEMFDPDISDAPTDARPPATQGTRTPPAPAPAPSEPPVARNSLSDVKARLSRDVAAILGAESSSALQRIDRIESDQELREVMRKLVELVKLYAGARKSEVFIRAYDEYIRG